MVHAITTSWSGILSVLSHVLQADFLLFVIVLTNVDKLMDQKNAFLCVLETGFL